MIDGRLIPSPIGTFRLYASRAAANLLVDKFISSGSTLGLGSGELVNLVISEVGSRLAAGSLQSITAVPSCNAAASSAVFHGVPLSTLEQLGKVCLRRKASVHDR